MDQFKSKQIEEFRIKEQRLQLLMEMKVELIQKYNVLVQRINKE